jgi:hypothetical protein
MRWLLSSRVPTITRILLVESGPRTVADAVAPRLREVFGPTVAIDLLTCMPESQGEPRGLESGPDHITWRVTEQPDNDARWRLLREIRNRRHEVCAILCADDGTMSPWRSAVVALLPAKFLIVNENADFFWLDRAHFSNLSKLALSRAGLLGDSAVRVAAHLLLFPFTLTYLLLYGGYVHTVRLIRMALRLGPRHPARADDLDPVPEETTVA